jgi:hypothetical protein
MPEIELLATGEGEDHLSDPARVAPPTGRARHIIREPTDPARAVLGRTAKT